MASTIWAFSALPPASIKCGIFQWLNNLESQRWSEQTCLGLWFLWEPIADLLQEQPHDCCKKKKNIAISSNTSFEEEIKEP